MEYEYNGNLLEDDRINLVASEIVNKYPQININKAMDAAMLEGKISSDKTVEMEFNRLYNIILVTNDDKKSVRPTYIDLVNLLKNNEDDERIKYYYTIALEIANFLLGKRDFPFLNEF